MSRTIVPAGPSARRFKTRPAEPDQGCPRPKTLDQGEESSIEGGNLAIVASGEQQQMGFSHCAAAVHALGKRVSMIGDTHRVRPERVTTDGPEAGHEMRRLAW